MRLDHVFVVAPRAIASAVRLVELSARVASNVTLITLLEEHSPARVEFRRLRAPTLDAFVDCVVSCSRECFVDAHTPRIGLLCIHDRLLGFVQDSARQLARSDAVEVAFSPPPALAKLRDKEWLESWRARNDAAFNLQAPSAIFDLDDARADDAVETLLARYAPYAKLVAKPALGTQSVGVIRFANAPGAGRTLVRHLRTALRQDFERYGMPVALSPESGMRIIVQPLIAGVEVAADGSVSKGRATFIVHEKRQTGEEFARDDILLAHYPRMSPGSPRYRNLQSLIEDAFVQAGMGDWPFHAEAIVNAKGVFLLEINARPAGGLIAVSASRMSGVDAFADVVRAALGQPLPPVLPKPGLFTCEVTVYPPRSGIVCSVNGLDELECVDGYVAHRVFTSIGETVLVSDREEYGVIAVVEASSHAEAIERARRVKELIQIDVS